jgi:MinD-like ATPase involved in chromosome partitioning or flagellar assembly
LLLICADCASRTLREANLAAFDVADLVCVVSSGSPPSLRATQHLLELLSKLGAGADRQLLILNRTSPHSAGSHDIRALADTVRSRLEEPVSARRGTG